MKNARQLSLALGLALCTYGCQKDDLAQSNGPAAAPIRHGPIHGHIVSFPDHSDVPFATVALLRYNWMGADVLYSFTADDQGRFSLDRGVLSNTANAFDACGRDPDTQDIYEYQSGCTSFLVNTVDSLVITLYPNGWLHFMVADEGDPDPQFTAISSGPMNTDGSMNYTPPFYPDQYGAGGYVIPCTGFQDYVIPMRFITGDDGIADNDSLAFLPVHTIGFDTVDVSITY